MRIQSPILAQAAEAAASRAIPESRDGILNVPPQINLTAELPGITRAISQSLGVNPIELRDSGIVIHNASFNVDSVNFVVRLLEGIWELVILHQIWPDNAGGDATAFTRLQMQIPPNSGQIISHLSLVSSVLNPVVLKFKIAVSRLFPFEIVHSIEAGGGVSTWDAQVSVFANRII